MWTMMGLRFTKEGMLGNRDRDKKDGGKDMEIHYFGADPKAECYKEWNGGYPDRYTAHCGSQAPMENLTQDWAQVTCKGCLRHKN